MIIKLTRNFGHNCLNGSVHRCNNDKWIHPVKTNGKLLLLSYYID